MRKAIWAFVTAIVLLLTVVVTYSLVIGTAPPSSQSADVNAIIDAFNPDSDAGLRVDFIIDVPTTSLGCSESVAVTAILSGTPMFWSKYESALKGDIRLGIGISAPIEKLRIADFSGANLPSSLGNLRGYDEPRIPSPSGSGKMTFVDSIDQSTTVSLHRVTIEDWWSHRTPIVVEFDSRLTSRRTFNSCFVALPTLTADDSNGATYATWGAFGITNSSDERPPVRWPGAVTFGRVLVRTNGHLEMSDASPTPALVDRNAWVSGLGRIGEQVAVWTCTPSATRSTYPTGGVQAPDSFEITPPTEAAAHADCSGLAIVESTDAGRSRDIALLIVGALFSLAVERVVRGSRALADARANRAKTAAK